MGGTLTAWVLTTWGIEGGEGGREGREGGELVGTAYREVALSLCTQVRGGGGGGGGDLHSFLSPLSPELTSSLSILLTPFLHSLTPSLLSYSYPPLPLRLPHTNSPLRPLPPSPSLLPLSLPPPLTSSVKTLRNSLLSALK